MIFKSLCLLTIFNLLCTVCCSEHKYDFFITDFIENTFDKNAEVICIQNLKRKKIRIKKEKVLENIETIDSKTVGSDMLTLVNLIENDLDKRGPELKIQDDNLKELFDSMIWNHTDCSKDEYIKCLEESLWKISGPITDYFTKKRIRVFSWRYTKIH